MAASSPKTRSPCSSTKSSRRSPTKSSVCGRFGMARDLGALPGRQAPVDRCWSRPRRSSRRAISSRDGGGSSAGRSCGDAVLELEQRLLELKLVRHTPRVTLPAPERATRLSPTMAGAGIDAQLLHPHHDLLIGAGARARRAACGPGGPGTPTGATASRASTASALGAHPDPARAAPARAAIPRAGAGGRVDQGLDLLREHDAPLVAVVDAPATRTGPRCRKARAAACTAPGTR